MVARTLSISFSADSKTAIREVKSLYLELDKIQAITTKLQSNISKFSVNSAGTGVIDLERSMFAVDLFNNKLRAVTGSLKNVGKEKSIKGAISSWNKAIETFNTSLMKSKTLISEVNKDLTKTVNAVSKPLIIKVKNDDSEKDGETPTLGKEAEKISKRKINLENRELKTLIAKNKATEKESSNRIKNERKSKAESIIQSLQSENTGDTGIFKPDSVSTNAPRRFGTVESVRAEYARQQRREDNFGKTETRFGTIRRNLPNEDEQVDTTELQKLTNKKIDDYLKPRREADIKEEMRRRQRIADAKKAGLRYTDEGGIGYGASKLKTSAELNKPGLFSAARSYAGSQFSQFVPGNLQQVVTGAKEIGTAMGAANVAGMALASTISVGIVAAIGVANVAMEQFNKQVAVARADQLSLVAISEETQRIYGATRQQSDAFYESIQKNTEIAARSTSVSSEEVAYLNRISTATFIRAYANTGESLDTLSQKMVDINTRFSILGQSTPGVTKFQVQNAYTSAISGDLANAMKRQEFFRNSGFRDILTQIAQEKGIDLSTATQTQQIDVLDASLKRRVSDTLINRQNESIDSRLSAFNDKLFAQRTGVFGIQRDLNEDIEGNQSLFTEISRTVELIFGTNGFFDQIGKIFGAMNLDVMAALRNGLRFINDLIVGVNMFIGALAKIFSFIGNIPLLPGLNVGKALRGAVSLATLEPLTRARSYSGAVVQPQATASFTGNLPDDYQRSYSLSNAINIENKNKPPNSSLVIANSSEYIFPNKQAVMSYADSQKVTLSSGNRAGVTLNSGSIVINANANQSPQEIAKAVIEELNRQVSYKTSLVM